MPSVIDKTETITKVLFEATTRQKICSLSLEDEPEVRIVHPYGVCQTGKNKIMIICWQESGFAGGSKTPGYRNLALMKCTTVELLDMHFLIRGDFNPLHNTYLDWVFHVAMSK
ncbi:MAG: hypothetical protein WKF87_00335 [Chryseolinea sp.]